MIKIKFSINIDKPLWFAKLFPCKHEVVSVEENPLSRYGTHTSYIMCVKCGKKANDISRNCKHVEDIFGRCIHCLERISKHDCKHDVWNKEPETEAFFCNECGEWKDEI